MVRQQPTAGSPVQGPAADRCCDGCGVPAAISCSMTLGWLQRLAAAIGGRVTRNYELIVRALGLARPMALSTSCTGGFSGRPGFPAPGRFPAGCRASPRWLRHCRKFHIRFMASQASLAHGRTTLERRCIRTASVLFHRAPAPRRRAAGAEGRALAVSAGSGFAVSQRRRSSGSTTRTTRPRPPHGRCSASRRNMRRRASCSRACSIERDQFADAEALLIGLLRDYPERRRAVRPLFAPDASHAAPRQGRTARARGPAL